MEALTWMDKIERELGKFRSWIYNGRGFLLTMGILTLVGSALSMWGMFLLDVDKRPTWLNIFIVVILISLVIYGIIYCGHTYNGDRSVSLGMRPRNHPNILCMVKGNAKAIVLAVFVLLDSTLKHQSKLWVILFCVFFFLHLVHFMVLFGITEEYDVAGGFIQASFVLIFEITTGKWQVALLIVGTIVLTCYKTFLIEGVALKEEELPVMSGQTGEVDNVNEG